MKTLKLQRSVNYILHSITWGGKATRLKYKDAHEQDKVSNVINHLIKDTDCNRLVSF